MRSVQFCLIISSLSLVSCVSTSTYKAAQLQATNYDSLYTQSMRTLKTCQDNNDNLTRQKATLQSQYNQADGMLTASQENNAVLRKQLQDLSTITSSQAESIRKSLDNIGAKDMYLQDLRAAISRRDSLNLAIILDLKATIGGLGEDVSIKIEKGMVHVDLADKILFDNDSNSYTLNTKAKSVIGRLARVLNDQPDLEFMIEGHTDSVGGDDYNLALSERRAEAVGDALRMRGVPADRFEIKGLGKAFPVASNDDASGRQQNRRVEIVFSDASGRFAQGAMSTSSR